MKTIREERTHTSPPSRIKPVLTGFPGLPEETNNRLLCRTQGEKTEVNERSERAADGSKDRM